MFSDVNSTEARAFYLAVCSGKGGVGKSTVSLLIASRLAESGCRTLLVDADFGLGDLATMTNVTVSQGLEDLFQGRVSLEEAALRVGPRLWLLGTKPGSYLPEEGINPLAIPECSKSDTLFDVVVIDTPGSLGRFNLKLISACDLALTVTTPRIPAVADTYVQLKRILELRDDLKCAFLVNLVESEAEAEQAKGKFRELVSKFLKRQILPLAVLAQTPGLVQAAETQALLELTRKPNEISKAFAAIANLLQDNYLKNKRSRLSPWLRLETSAALKDVGTFDDRRRVALELPRNVSTELLVNQ
jgi:flagellar biosynthesis protein FlhG